MYENITGIILSGGKSTRMGTNKSFLKIGDKTIIELTIDLMKSLFPRVLLVTNEPKLYKNFNVETITDIYTYKGPLAGIHSGLYHSETEGNFIISCDMPLITRDILEFIIDYQSDKLVKITKADGFIQQLCGYYSKQCLDYAEDILTNKYQTETRDYEQKKRKCNVMRLVDTINACIIDIEKEYPEYKPGSFMNMNKPHEYEQILERLQTDISNKIPNS